MWKTHRKSVTTRLPDIAHDLEGSNLADALFIEPAKRLKAALADRNYKPRAYVANLAAVEAGLADLKKLRQHLTANHSLVSQEHLKLVISNLNEFKKALAPKKSRG